MSDTPKARELGLPWTPSFYGFSERSGRCDIVSPDEHYVAMSVDAEFAKTVIPMANLIGPHIDDAERMAVFRAVAGMDDLDFGVMLDLMKEKGWVETR